MNIAIRTMQKVVCIFSCVTAVFLQAEEPFLWRHLEESQRKENNPSHVVTEKDRFYVRQMHENDDDNRRDYKLRMVNQLFTNFENKYLIPEELFMLQAHIHGNGNKHDFLSKIESPSLKDVIFRGIESDLDRMDPRDVKDVLNMAQQLSQEKVDYAYNRPVSLWSESEQNYQHYVGTSYQALMTFLQDPEIEKEFLAKTSKQVVVGYTKRHLVLAGTLGVVGSYVLPTLINMYR